MAIKKFLKAAQDIKNQAQQEEPKAPAAHDESNWLVSYADMMTLLCGFFIMLFSMAKMDEPQYEKVQEAMSKQFGGDFKSPTKELAKFVTEVVQQAGIDSQAIVRTDALGVSVAFQSTLFFDTLSAEVKPEGRQVLERLARELYERQKAENKQYQIVVEGHTDSRPITAGTFPSNWELSGARAARVVRYFLDEHFSPDHMTAIGYADTRPEAPSRLPNGALDEEALAHNRRVVLRILSDSADSIPLPKIETAALPAPGARPVAAAAPGRAAPAAPAARMPASVPAQAPAAPAMPAARQVAAPTQVAPRIAPKTPATR
jgi:chemotaxis protein MotB